MKPLTYMGHGYNPDRFHPGFLEVYYGPMRSGKSDSLIKRIDKFNYSGGLEYIAFHPEEDVRTPGKIASRIGTSKRITAKINAIQVPGSDPNKILGYIEPKHGLIVIDEAQFFNADIVSVVESLLAQNRNVVIGGLNLDFRGENFGQMSYFITHADYPNPLFAACAYKTHNDSGVLVPCSQRAQFTQRLIDGEPAPYNSDVVALEDKKSFLTDSKSPNQKQPKMTYEPRCRMHHTVPGRARNGGKK
ncbi:MAG: thymidine kinase [Candidatus Woesearchaeota archaeon]